MTDRIQQMAPTAARLACAVADMDVRESHAILRRLTRPQLLTIAVILAASVDLDRPLGELAAAQSKEPMTAVQKLAVIVAAHRSVSADAIFSASRERPVTEARQIVCWLATTLGHKSTHIGTALGRDHTTVLHSVEKVTSTPELLAAAQEIHDEMEGEAA